MAQSCCNGGGPRGMHVPEHNLDFSRTGPWYSVMQNAEGQTYKVSGHVTHVDPPNSVGFTWACTTIRMSAALKVTWSFRSLRQKMVHGWFWTIASWPMLRSPQP